MVHVSKDKQPKVGHVSIGSVKKAKFQNAVGIVEKSLIRRLTEDSRGDWRTESLDHRQEGGFK